MKLASFFCFFFPITLNFVLRRFASQLVQAEKKLCFIGLPKSQSFLYLKLGFWHFFGALSPSLALCAVTGGLKTWDSIILVFFLSISSGFFFLGRGLMLVELPSSRPSNFQRKFQKMKKNDFFRVSPPVNLITFLNFQTTRSCILQWFD